MTYNVRWTEEPQLIKIADVLDEKGLFPRERIDVGTVAEYAEAMQEEARLPPIRIIRDPDGRLLLVDGWHRVAASRKLGDLTIYARIRNGDWSDAVEGAAAQNARHGLKRSNADKRRAVEMLLALPKWAHASDRAIAQQCAVHHELVGEVRRNIKGLRPAGNSASYAQPLENIEPDLTPPRERRVVRRGEQEYQMTLPRRKEPMPSEPWGGPPSRDDGQWPTMRLPIAITYLDIIAWLAAASDRERRRLADDAFSAIVSAEERLNHDEKVQEWLAEHERGDAGERARRS